MARITISTNIRTKKAAQGISFSLAITSRRLFPVATALLA
jgi:hypothetical protein